MMFPSPHSVASCVRTCLFLATATLTQAPGGGTASACPAYLNAQALPPSTTGIRRNLKAFVIETKDNGERTWKRVGLQVDPLDENGVLRSEAEGQPALLDQAMTALDRIVIRRESFGAQLQAGDKAPCAAEKAVVLQNPDQKDKFAYLAFCSDAEEFAAYPAPVTINPTLMKIAGPRFEYDYYPNNQLLYRSLIAKGPQQSDVAAESADVNIHMDIRRFFTMNFTNKNVESYVMASRSGEVGTTGSINFFLRMLFFKIDLKMATTVGFFEDSGHIPTMIDVPRDAPKMLNPGSGLLYLWTTKAASFDQSNPSQTMPFAKPESILAGWENHAQNGLVYCKQDKDICNFRLRGSVIGQKFGLDINIPKHLVARGFYPVWVPDVATFKKDMKWNSSPSDAPGVVGVYFENGGLLKGQYKLDQWLRIGSEQDIASVCPRAVDANGTISFKSKTADGIAH